MFSCVKLPGLCNKFVHTFSSFYRRAKNPRTTYEVHTTFLVNQEILCGHTTFHLSNSVKVIHSFRIILKCKNAEKYAGLKFAKYSQQKWRLKYEPKSKESCMGYIHFSWQNQENSCTHTTFCFLNFTNIIDFVSINNS